MGSAMELQELPDANQSAVESPYDGDGLHCLKGVVCQGTLDALVQLIALGPRHTSHA